MRNLNKIFDITNNTKKEKITMKNENLELLNSVYKNVTMATHAIDSLQNKIEDPKLLKLMNKQNKIYEKTK